MEKDVCLRDCHACTIQEGGDAHKARCATLLLPAMVNELSKLIADLFAKLDEVQLYVEDISIPEVDPIKLNPVKLENQSNLQTPNTESDESIETSDL